MPKKVYASEITSEEMQNKYLNGNISNLEVVEDVRNISSIDYDIKDDAQKWIDETSDVLEKNYDIVSEKIIEKTVTSVIEEKNIEESFDNLKDE